MRGKETPNRIRHARRTAISGNIAIVSAWIRINALGFEAEFANQLGNLRGCFKYGVWTAFREVAVFPDGLDRAAHSAARFVQRHRDLTLLKSKGSGQSCDSAADN